VRQERELPVKKFDEAASKKADGSEEKVRVLGIMGYPVGHSLSPAMHNAALRHLGLKGVYLPFEVLPGYLEEAVAGIRALGLWGVNVTIPYKEKVLDYLDWLTPQAELIGAVNCIACREGRLEGHNTDGEGFLRSLREEGGFDPEGKEVLVLGAGGAARAIALVLGQSRAQKIVVANRTREKAEELAAQVRRRTAADAAGIGLGSQELASAAFQADLIVQTTPVGMYPHEEPPDWFKPEWFKADTLVYDIIYRPRPTAFLRQAAARGCRTLDGLGMLVFQGALAFSWWTGLDAPAEVMREAALRELGS